MKKFLAVLVLVIVIVALLGGIAWMNKTSLLARALSRQMHVKVALQSLDIDKQSASMERLWVGTPTGSRTSTSFSAETIDVNANMMKVLEDPLIIDQIVISNILVGIEYYSNKETNWNYILGKSKKGEAPGRKYLIRTLVLNNLTVVVTQADGKQKTYPTLDQMVFHNISSDSGFPVQEIEKAIFQKVMQDLFDKFNLFKQFPFDSLPGNSPLKYLPGLLK